MYCFHCGDTDSHVTDGNGWCYACAFDHPEGSDAPVFFCRLCGKTGAFYTPRYLAYLLANLLQPQQGERIADLACGGGRLIWSVYLFLQAASRKERVTSEPDGHPHKYSQWPSEPLPIALLGCDIQSTAIEQTQALLHLSGGGRHTHMYHRDALSHSFFQQWEKGMFAQLDGAIANPPYGSVVDQENLAAPLKAMKTSNAELLFIEIILQLLKPHSKWGIVPQGKGCVCLTKKMD